MSRLLQDANAAGVLLREGFTVTELLQRGERVLGVRGHAGEAGADATTRTQDESLLADHVLVAAGAWTPVLLPWLADDLAVVGQPVLHLRVDDPVRWQPPGFLTFTADIARTGYYGFPAQHDGTLKFARHGAGRRLHPDDPREVSADEITAARAFLALALPELADAPLILTRLCLYSDTADGHFWIDHDPERPGLIVAAGGSGHAFKFAPVLGELIADVVERRPNERAECMRWTHRVAPDGTRAPGGDEARADRRAPPTRKDRSGG